MHNTESRFAIGSSNIQFGGVYVCTSQPGNFTGWGSEGVKILADFATANNLSLSDFELYLGLLVWMSS